MSSCRKGSWGVWECVSLFYANGTYEGFNKFCSNTRRVSGHIFYDSELCANSGRLL